ncbi:MAG: arginine--tRNA ligase [Pseudanabaenaceae cyanobacterium]
MNIAALLSDRCRVACAEVAGESVPAHIYQVFPSKDSRFGDYQCNGAMALAKELKTNPRQLASQIVANLEVEDICQPPEIAGPGFINLRLKPEFLEITLAQNHADPRLGIAPNPQPEKVIVDFSSPNIAKEMHVGHLRSTIIGDCIARIFEFLGHEVLRLNHVGDWGTQFGMLIAYLKEVYPQALVTKNALALGDLVTFYRAAKQRFDQDENFRERARLGVVDLQSGEPSARQAWELLCEQSRQEFQKIYELLDIKLIERGESFYNPYLPAVVADLEKLGLLTIDQGAKCVFLEGFTNKDGEKLPLIVQKSDGGYNYATTDLAALRYRIDVDRAQRIIYVTDIGQSDHFAQVFQVAKRAGWLPDHVKAIHVPFGLVLGEDGKKFKTRSGDTVPLKSLIEEAIQRAYLDIDQRNPTAEPEFKQQVAKVIGISAIKYADLSQNRLSNYVFSYDKMLSLQGNTAPYLLYAYVRVQGIGRKGEIDFGQLNLERLHLTTEPELMLAKHLLQLAETISTVTEDLLPNRLCQYLYELSQKFNQFFEQCPVLQAKAPVRNSRLFLCDLTARTLKLGLSLLGIEVLERM